MIHLTEIEERARAATPGHWRVWRPDVDEWAIVCAHDETDTIADVPNIVNARHIAAMSPDVALALVKVARSAKAMVDQSDTYYVALPLGVDYQIIALRDALKEIQE